MSDYAQRMQNMFKEENRLQEIYYDTGGTFMIEGVTNPIGLVAATDAIVHISDGMLQAAEKLGLSPAGFGSVSADEVIRRLNAMGDAIQLPEYATGAFTHYKGEVFDLPEGKTLVGRGQHCNLSLWAGDNNLFIQEGSRQGSFDLVHHAAAKALEWLPHMFLPCRKGNYHRIKAGSRHGVHEFSIGYLDSEKSNHVLRYAAYKAFRAHKPESFRLEFRQGASEADPYDVALASAVPLVKICEEVLEKDNNGKIKLDNRRKPRVLTQRAFPSIYQYDRPVPKTEEEAEALFLSAENPYFTYLNELADRRIQKARDKCNTEPSVRHKHALREAEKLRDIGGKLCAAYCEEYGMDNPMPDKPAIMALS